jgi:transcriptional regulator
VTLYAHPKHLLAPDEAQAALAAFDRAAYLVTTGEDGFAASRLPMLVEGGQLLGHLARANAQLRHAPGPALAICPGPETYVSPGWYETKKRTGRAVPTWNYETLHVHGQLTVFDDKTRLKALVEQLSQRHEQERPTPWSVDDAPEDYIEALLGAIVGVEITIERIEGKRKISQEKPAEDRAGVLAALDAADDPRDRAIAEAMRRSS